MQCVTEIMEPLVSIIIPTKNSASTIARTLLSVKNQTYRNLEVIVVDNHSTDDTISIVKRVIPEAKVFMHGPERAAQKNHGAERSSGELLYFIDSDFILERHVVREAVELIQQGCDAVLIHNTSDPNVSFWARVRKLERDCYYKDDKNVAARFMKRNIFFDVGGFDESLTAGEDYDLHLRLKRAGAKMGWCKSVEYHIGEPRSLSEVVKTHIYYGKYILRYIRKRFSFSIKQLSPFRASYVRNMARFAKHPDLLLGFLIYQYVRYAAALAGVLTSSGMLKAGTTLLYPSVSSQTPELLHEVSIVIPTRNRHRMLASCLKSIENDAGNIPEIIVVDDASIPPVEKPDKDNIIIVRNSRRRLLNESRNIGARLSSRKYILFVDDDITLAKGCIRGLASTLESSSRIAVASPLILDERGKVWYAGGWISPLSGITVFHYRGMEPEKIREKRIETELFHSCFMVRKEALFEVGLFDSLNFPMYLGEADLSERLRNAGYRIVVNTESIAYHSIPGLGMKSLLRNIHIENPTRSYLVARNRKIFMRKYRPKPIFLIYLLIFDPVISFIHMATIIGSKEKKYKGTHLLGAYLRGYLDGVLGRVKFGKKLLEGPQTVDA